MPYFRMPGHVFMETQLLYFLIVTRSVYKNIFDNDLNELSISNFIEIDFIETKLHRN